MTAFRMLVLLAIKNNSSIWISSCCRPADVDGVFKVAARTLGDLVRKLGERVLPEIIPILERGLDSEKSDERQGVCIGLSEIVSSTSKEQVKHD